MCPNVCVCVHDRESSGNDENGDIFGGSKEPNCYDINIVFDDSLISLLLYFDY